MFDPECYDLALYFLVDELNHLKAAARQDVVNELAQAFQDAAEDAIQMNRRSESPEDDRSGRVSGDST